jgi:hypothetical protein
MVAIKTPLYVGIGTISSLLFKPGERSASAVDITLPACAY